MAMAGKPQFTEEDMVVEDGLGYPTAYAKLCRKVSTYSQGPPFAILPYALQPHESARVKEFNQIFPIVNPDATPTADPRTYINLLWKQLSHLGNAGFDPALFRVDPCGNVLYFHADSASPLYWDIDHWFPCARGGRTVLSNLRLLQWQVCKKKHTKLEFLIPWWDLQLGISVNQFLCIFASRNSDFRNRAFSYLFLEGGNEELNELEFVEGHTFPQHFSERKRQVGLAPAAVTISQRHPGAALLKHLNHKSRPLRPSSPSLDDKEGLGKAIHRSWPSMSKENDDPNVCNNENKNPYFSIALARESLRGREEAKKKQAEMRELEDELGELKQKNEAERVVLQDLEAALIWKRKRMEKCRRLSEAQASYRAQLEKMIRDAMHQNVVYKEQVRLNQAACNTLVARLEAQKTMLDTSEEELLKRCKQRDDLEKQVIPFCEEHGRKRSWTDDMLNEDGPDDTTHLSQSSRRKMRKALRKELRVFLEEEQKASELGISFDGGFEMERLVEYRTSDSDELAVDCQLKGPATEQGQGSHQPVEEEGHMTQLGKRNVEKWLQMLLDKAEDGPCAVSSARDIADPDNHTEETIRKLNAANPPKEIKFLRLKEASEKKEEDTASVVLSEKSNLIDPGRKSFSSCRGTESSRNLDVKGKAYVRMDSPRTSSRFTSSPLMMGVKRGIDCISRRPPVIGDNDVDGNQPSRRRASQ
ncbi:hypothetical protein Taro_040780 [Colocasia esculenta]|uniref:Uncharacterized protein n=1 Tax=Colocasia esculenta TaxID=4460 RepID=A0A843WVI1_COLES|nr:hypothetical protein [Colocasia esculenta]